MSKNIVLAVDAASHDPARHVLAAAAAILHAAADHDARMVVLGSSSRTELPLIQLGSVAGRLLHMATRPVLIVPRTDAHAEPVQASAGADQG
jgi:nucleotide-binding universal stress UspA family protein